MTSECPAAPSDELADRGEAESVDTTWPVVEE